MPSQLTTTKVSLPRVYATIPSSVHSFTKMFECLLLVGPLGVWARLGRGMEEGAEQGVGVGHKVIRGWWPAVGGGGTRGSQRLV